MIVFNLPTIFEAGSPADDIGVVAGEADGETGGIEEETEEEETEEEE